MKINTYVQVACTLLLFFSILFPPKSSVTDNRSFLAIEEVDMKLEEVDRKLEYNFSFLSQGTRRAQIRVLATRGRVDTPKLYIAFK